MKVLIGTPVHIKNDDLIQKWLENVSRLKSRYPADFLMVDSSPGLSYVDKVKGYCVKYKIRNYYIKHIDVHQENGMDEMIGRSREVIRQHLLSSDYDAWFSFELNQEIPADTLGKLVGMAKKGDYTIIHQNFGATKIPIEFWASFDCTLIQREALESYGFLLTYPNMPNVWHRGESWFKKQVVENGGSYLEVYGSIKNTVSKKMKVLIGTPIHQVKGYCVERWLESVSKLGHPADLLMVDNSPGLGFVEEIKKYAQKKGLKNYKLVHIEIAPELVSDRRVEMSQEVIRQYLLSRDYDAWFAWECDQVLPANALDKLMEMMQAGDFMMVNHNGWVRGHPGKTNTNFGVSLLKKEVLKDYSFLLEYGFDSDMPEVWVPGEVWIKEQVLKSGGNALEVEGVIGSIEHLDK